MKLFPIYLTVTVVLAISIGLWSRDHMSSSPSVNSRTLIPASGGQSAMQLRDICRCYVITGSEGVDKLLDASTGQLIDNPLFGGLDMVNGYANAAVSPNGEHVAATYRDNAQLTLADIPLSKPKTIYTAPNGQIIAGLAWAVDGSVLVFGLENAKDSPPSEGVVPTTLLKYDIASQKITTLFKLSDVGVIHGIAMYPEAIDHNADSIVIMVPTSDKQYFHSLWHSRTKTFTRFDGPGDGSSGMVVRVDNASYLLYKNTDKIERFNMTDGVTTSMVIPKWFDGPYNGPSSDGRRIVYMQRETGQTKGSLATFDIISGQTTVLTPAVIDVNNISGSVVWTPDDKDIIYFDTNQNKVKFYLVQVGQGAQSPEAILVPAVPDQDWIYQLIGHGQQSSQFMTLISAGEPDLSQSQQTTLDKQIENWSLYSPDTKTQIGDPTCQYPDAARQLAAIDAAGKRSLNLNNGLLLTFTPNIYNWDSKQLETFGNEVVCGVATNAPRAIVGDKIIWWTGNCAGGVGLVKDTPGYQGTVRCLQAEEVVNKHFHQEEVF